MFLIQLGGETGLALWLYWLIAFIVSASLGGVIFLVIFFIGKFGIVMSDYGNIIDEDFIHEAYSKYLGRPPDDEGKDYYLNQLKTRKMKRKDVIKILKKGEV